MRAVSVLFGALAVSMPWSVCGHELLRDVDDPAPLASTPWLTDWPLWRELEEANPLSDAPIRREPRYVDPYGWQFIQDPYRLGFSKHDELVLLSSANAAGGATTGSMQVTEFYSWVRYSCLAQPDVLLNMTGIFDGYYWSGPTMPHLPGQVDRLSLDMEAVFLGEGPINTIVGFHPQIVADLQEHLSSKAWNFDGRLIQTFRYNPDWMFVYGFAIWDRVDVMFIPELGAVWTPNDRWELRLLFPRSQINYRLGEVWGGQTWLTSNLEYVVQSYQVDFDNVGVKERIQLQDWRATVGVRQDYHHVSWTADIGVVFNRNVKFRGPTPDFDLDPSALFRIGLWF